MKIKDEDKIILTFQVIFVQSAHLQPYLHILIIPFPVEDNIQSD